MWFYVRLLATGVCVTFGLIGCGGRIFVAPVPRGVFPAGMSAVPLSTANRSGGGSCAVSTDGFIWYSLPAGGFPAIDFSDVRCTTTATIDGNAPITTPLWATAPQKTQAIFVATSLQEAYSSAGMTAIEGAASAAGLPVTWMIGNPTYLAQNGADYNAFHASNGDDVELENNPSLYALAAKTLPWFTPAVSVEGAGRERNIAGAVALGNDAFWGITWNSHGTDNTSDEGAPWGTYCADPASYKRPSSSGCTLLSFEWTARDLTRAYFTDTHASGYSAEAAFSTDPDDVLIRAGFSPPAGAAYVASLVDAYAAAGASAPLIMMSQQESVDQGSRPSDGAVLAALYGEAKRVAMHTMTLRQADVAARAFSANPRAIAFPYVPGGNVMFRNGVALLPATIDYHDGAAGMTFASGHTLPDRTFVYAQDPVSAFNRILVPTYPSDPAFPALRSASVSSGVMSFAFNAPAPTHFGIAIWSDPALLGVSGPNITAAGHAGFVATFDLPAGSSTQTIACSACTSTTFPYSR